MTLSPKPWYVPVRGGFARFGLLVLSSLLFMVGIGSIFSTFSATNALSKAFQSSNNIPQALGSFLLSAIICGGSIYGVIALYRRANHPSSFRPKNAAIAPETYMAPFEVKFRRRTYGRDFDGSGTVAFSQENLILDGSLAPPVWLQIIVVLLVTIVPLILVRIGLGFIAAFLLANYIGRRKSHQEVPYNAIRNLVITQCQVSFTIDGVVPQRVEFYASGVDGERLYRELFLRFPAALNGWQPV